MKERFSSAKSQLARLIDNTPMDSSQKTSNNQVPKIAPWKEGTHISAFQPTDDQPGMNKSVSETSTSARLDQSEANSFTAGIQGKMELLMARTKNIEQKLITQLQTSPKNKVLSSNTQLKSQKAFKNFQRTDKFKEQLQNQPSVKQSCDGGKINQVIETLWKQILGRSFDSRLVEDETTQLFMILKKWKQNSINYLTISEQITANLEADQKAEVELPKLLEGFLKEKKSLYEQLHTVKDQIVRLTSVISKLETDRSFFVGQINDRDNRINALDLEVQRLKLNNNCMTEIIYKLQQKKAQNEMRVQREVYEHLQEQNLNLKNTLAKIVQENKILTRAITQQISFVRDAIIEQIKKKMLLRADLIKAQQTIQELRNMSQMDLSGIRTNIFKQLKVNHQVYEKILPENLNFETDPSQELSSDTLHNKLTESNDYIAQLEGLLNESRKINGDFEQQKYRLQGLVRKQEYEKEHIRKQVNQIKKILFEGEIFTEDLRPIECELSSILHRSVEIVYKLKHLKERNSLLQSDTDKRQQEFTKLVNEYEVLTKRFMAMRLQKNPSGSEQKLIELQNANTQLKKEVQNINNLLKSKEVVIRSREEQIKINHEQILKKNEQLKDMFNTIQKLVIENKKLQQQKDNCNEIANPQRIQHQQFDQDDLVLQLQANMSDCKRSKSKSPNKSGFLDLQESKIKYINPLKRMKSLSICSQQDQIIQDIPSNNHNSHINKSTEHKSEISDCWKDTSGIHQLAVRIDNEGILTFKIDELIEKYDLRSDVSQILSIFLKKLDKVQNIQELLFNIENMLSSLKGLSDLQTQQDNGFLKFNLSKMEEIFAKTRAYLTENHLIINPDKNIDSDDENLDQLTLHSVIKN